MFDQDRTPQPILKLLIWNFHDLEPIHFFWYRFFFFVTTKGEIFPPSQILTKVKTKKLWKFQLLSFRIGCWDLNGLNNLFQLRINKKTVLMIRISKILFQPRKLGEDQSLCPHTFGRPWVCSNRICDSFFKWFSGSIHLLAKISLIVIVDNCHQERYALRLIDLSLEWLLSV